MMTIKEAQDKLSELSGRAYDEGFDAAGFAYDMAQLMLDGVENRSEEMIEWVGKEYRKSRKEWMNKTVWDDSALRFWEGCWWVLNKFLDKFQDKQTDQLWIRGWDLT